MADQIATGGVHHLRLTVTDVGRAQAFYGDLLGFKPVAEFPPAVILGNGSMLLALGPASSAAGDRFDEGRVGLDHLSFSVQRRADLEAAVAVLDARGIGHSEIRDLGPGFGIHVLIFRDPDNIQLELTAPYD